ncbi:zinc-dependent metalloprotease [Streptomyces mirabilis]|uniref:zinc-dependent metalloprotease n=1 Tax=Streptomyces mirabilis TaxID=68239 RepID=UPI003667CB48
MSWTRSCAYVGSPWTASRAEYCRPTGQTGELEERAVLLRLLHRHEVTAVARLIGGVRYTYGLAGETGPGTVLVDAATQRRAATRPTSLPRAEQLALPVSVLDTLTPGRHPLRANPGAGRDPAPYCADSPRTCDRRTTTGTTRRPNRSPPT